MRKNALSVLLVVLLVVSMVLGLTACGNDEVEKLKAAIEEGEANG